MGFAPKKPFRHYAIQIPDICLYHLIFEIHDG